MDKAKSKALPCQNSVGMTQSGADCQGTNFIELPLQTVSTIKHSQYLKLTFSQYSSIHTNYIIPRKIKNSTALPSRYFGTHGQCFAAARLTWLGYGAGRKRENCSV